MKVLGLIPARGGSKGVPNKNIKLLNGKPLIQYTSDIALQSNLLAKVIVSTDDKKIKNIAEKLDLKVPFVRPEYLSNSNSPTLPVVKHALEFYKAMNINFDAVCLLQVTSPLRSLDFLNSCLNKFINNDCDSLISVKKVPDHFNPHWCFEPDIEGYLKIATGDNTIISRRQDLPNSYYRDGSIYITRSDVIINKNSLFGDKVLYEINPETRDLNIDTLEDWEKAEVMFKKFINGK